MPARTLTLTLAAAIAFALGTGVARGDGSPVLGFESGAAQTVASAAGGFTYSADPGGAETTVQRVASNGAALSVQLAGSFTVPVVAFDGSTGGLSADGRTLVLARPRVQFPQRTSTLAVLDAGSLRLRRLIRLPGDFSFDAISPHGQWIYLIQYVTSSPATVPVYQVRALDAVTGRLLSRVIVDPREQGEPMRGYPVTRVTGPGGRWDYTLYDDNGRPFIHALDTVTLTARCVDLPAVVANASLPQLGLTDGGAHLVVSSHRRVLAMIDTRALTVPRPRTASAWVVVLTLAAAVALLTATFLPLVRRSRARSPTATPAGSR